MSTTRSTKKRNAVLHVDKKKKEIIYNVSKESGQYKHIKKMCIFVLPSIISYPNFIDEFSNAISCTSPLT